MTDAPPQWPDRTFVTSKELAAIAGVVERTILREIERGHLEAVRHGGFIIDRPEAERWLAAYRQTDPNPTHC